jgi:hypothetical protein
MAIYESGVSGLNELLRDFRKLGKEAAKELRAPRKLLPSNTWCQRGKMPHSNTPGLGVKT